MLGEGGVGVDRIGRGFDGGVRLCESTSIEVVYVVCHTFALQSLAWKRSYICVTDALGAHGSCLHCNL